MFSEYLFFNIYLACIDNIKYIYFNRVEIPVKEIKVNFGGC